MRHLSSSGHWMQFVGLVETFNLIHQLSEKATLCTNGSARKLFVLWDALHLLSDLPAVRES